MGMSFSQGVGNTFGVPGAGAGIGMPGFQEGFQEASPELLTTQTDMFTQSLPSYQTTAFGGNQQQPMTQSNGQLPPGFGALSPIDRSQINPSANIGMTGGPMTGGNLVDYNGNPLGGGPFGTQNVMASPQPGVGFGGGKSMPAPSLNTQQMPQPRIAPRPMAAPRVAPRVNQGIIPVAQNARQVNAPRPVNPFARTRRR